MSFPFGTSNTQQQPLYPNPGPAQGGAFGDLGGVFPGAFVPNQSLGPDATTLDANNPDLFKENMKIVQTHIEHIKTLTSAAQLGMYGRFCLS
jgi:hypothetical protein